MLQSEVLYDRQGVLSSCDLSLSPAVTAAPERPRLRNSWHRPAAGLGIQPKRCLPLASSGVCTLKKDRLQVQLICLCLKHVRRHALCVYVLYVSAIIGVCGYALYVCVRVCVTLVVLLLHG
jgi:hypothetical protein